MINNAANAGERKQKYEKINIRTIVRVLDKDFDKPIIVYKFDNGRVQFPERRNPYSG